MIGKKSLVYVEVEQDYCGLNYGDFPCAAGAVNYPFRDSNNGWTPVRATLTTNSEYSTFTPTDNDPIIQSAAALTINGAENVIVSIDLIMTTAPTTWQGTLYYSTAGHVFSGLFYKNFPQPVLNQRTKIRIDMSTLTAGGTDWIENTITRLRFDLGNSNDGVFRIYSISVHPASKCFNTRKTCQDITNFSSEPVVLRFGMDTNYLPLDIECIPSIVDWSVSPAIISLGEDLGLRAEMRVTLKDHPWSDTGPGGDKYLTERPYNPFDLGTFWGKWRARVQFIRGRSIRLIIGYEGQTLEEMEKRHFVVDSFDGPTPEGTFTIVAKDPIKELDDDRAQAPKPTNGFLISDITDSAGSFTLAPTGIGDAEYPASGYINIGGAEICEFTRSGNTVTLTARGQLGTTAVAHSAQDRAQVVLYYPGTDPADIIYDLMVNYAGINPNFINLEDWQFETSSFLRRVFSTVIPDPTGVKKLITELVQQAALSIWWNEVDQKIRLRVLRNIELNAEEIGPDIIQRGTFRTQEQPDKRVSQVWIYYGQSNPLSRLEEEKNYRSLAITIDSTAELDYGSSAIRKIFSRWIASGGRIVATRVGDIVLGRYRDPPRRFNFSLLRDVKNITAGQGYRVQWWTIQDATGALSNAPIQITRLNPQAGEFVLEAEEQLYKIIDPEDLENRTIIFDAAITDVNLRTVHDQLYPAPVDGEAITVRCYIEVNVNVGASTSTNAAFNVGDWPSSVTIEVYNNGRIQGAGGKGGNAATTPTRGQDGQAGGLALYSRKAFILDNLNGKIYGGGGGGAGGGIKESGKLGGGGGGGAGFVAGAGGFGTNSGGSTNGSPGTLDAGGAGGTSTSLAWPGGAGGGIATKGANAGGGAVGGAAGGGIDGDSYITFTALGDVRGTRIN
jgi:hypothetical protein